MDIESFICDTARGAGQIIMESFGKVRSVRSKGDRGDVVTEVDLASEAFILDRIKTEHPNHNIISEEAGKLGDNPDELTWLVDPLDGTRNFSLGIPFFCTMIAAIKDGKPQHGVIYDPIHDELYHASKGRGAFLNGHPIRVSEESDLEDALVSVSWLRPRVNHRQFVDYVDKLTLKTSYLRRLGSAGMVLAYVSCGRMDAYIQGSINTWDIASGSLLVEEAGGKVTDFDGKPLDLNNPYIDILAAGPPLHDILLRDVVHTS